MVVTRAFLRWLNSEGRAYCFTFVSLQQDIEGQCCPDAFFFGLVCKRFKIKVKDLTKKRQNHENCSLFHLLCFYNQR